ncbi:hypothetical protein ACX80I_06710 [Arthrobacter sp. MDT3-44]
MTGLGTIAHWLSDHRAVVPSLAALFAVGMFWIVGLLGGIGYLHDASSPMMMLSGLYVMLAAVALSIIITTAALSHLAQHFSR